MLNSLEKDLQAAANKEKAVLLQRFFKTGKDEYGEGDVFLGIMVPEQRKLVLKYKDLPVKDIQKLLESGIHEYRLTGILILVNQYKRANDKKKKEIFDFYLKNAKYVNNWDLVDLSAPNIIGSYLLDKNRKILYKLAKSSDLWERRISIISTFAFIRNNDFKDSLKISEILLKDEHDLIHKAVGWMLREVGKRSLSTEEEFLKKHYKKMPRTMLRYAIEKFSDAKRQSYLKR